MAYKVVLFSTALKDIASQPHDMRARVTGALRELQGFPHDRSIKKLKPPFDGYRKRVGDYRILFDVTNGTIAVHRIKNRKMSIADK